MTDGSGRRMRNSSVPRKKNNQRSPRKAMVRKHSVMRGLELPMPSAEQVREAATAVKTRGVPTWRQLTAMDHFDRWLAELGDPFADAVLELQPDWGSLDEVGVFEADELAVARMRELARRR